MSGVFITADTARLMLGIRGVQFAKAMSCKVIAIDGGNKKQELCERSGADHFIDFKITTDVVQKVMTITGGGANAVIASAASKTSYMQV